MMDNAYGVMGGGMWFWTVAAVVIVALLAVMITKGIQQMIVSNLNG